MIQIATDSGLMPKPIRRREILLGPAERVEVIVDFSAARGRDASSCAAANATPAATPPAPTPTAAR